MIHGLMESCPFQFHQDHKPPKNSTELLCSFSSHGCQLLGPETASLMFALPLLPSLSLFTFLSFLCNFILFLLVKLLAYLYATTEFKDHKDDQTESNKKSNKKFVHWADENIIIREKVRVDNTVVEEQDGILFWLSEAPFSKNSLLGYEAREESGEIPPLEPENSFVAESPGTFPLQNTRTETNADHLLTENLSPLDANPSLVVVSRKKNTAQNGHDDYTLENNHPQIEHAKITNEAEIVYATENHPEIANEVVAQEKEENSNLFCGESTLTGESTSKSSVEWRSSTITKDSETELFSSSSRKSSSRWESYAFCRKYDEEMLYFHRISSEKLTETESFRSITFQPRSISQRIYQKLTTKNIRTPDEIRNPYRELENAYVAQVCLAWEAINWNYRNFSRHNPDPKEMGKPYCPAKVAQEFQQFQVLIQRFIENEPYGYGRRPEVYARMKVHSPKLLLVPEFTAEDDEKETQISGIEFLLILKDVIRTFMNFIKADKQTRCEKFRSMMKRRSATGDQNMVNFLQKTNRKKKMRLKDLIRRRRCFIQRKLVKVVEDEMEIIMGLIDLKVVSRVLRMPNVTEEQIHWCEQKMTKVRVLEGKIQRDSSPLAFPVH